MKHIAVAHGNNRTTIEKNTNKQIVKQILKRNIVPENKNVSIEYCETLQHTRKNEEKNIALACQQNF